jgi:dTDP-4-amino-4,6-dideoxygalactose transaminase
VNQLVPARVPFNLPPITHRELDYLRDAIERRELAGNGHYTRICGTWLEQRLGVGLALLTQSCTSALEMAALLSNLVPGDEVIMPSFTFVSTANAVVLRGATPVFVEIRRDTLNIDEGTIESAITPRTKAIFVVHYSGVPCEMNAINAIARRHGLVVVEDAAQALLSTYDGRPAGTLGDIGCFSFHATKNVTSGEGGALVTDRADIAERARIVWEKGTDRDRLLMGQIDKYTWVDVGSSFLPSELTAAFLAAQLESADEITEDRRATWALYHAAFDSLEQAGLVTRPAVPANVSHNGHLYYLLLKDAQTRDSAIRALKAQGIEAPFHYVPLHSTAAGRRFGRVAGPLAVTDDAAERLIRLPLWTGMGERCHTIIDAVRAVLMDHVRS